jgi:hypothetical protein
VLVVQTNRIQEEETIVSDRKREQTWAEWSLLETELEADMKNFIRYGRSIIQNPMKLNRDDIKKYLQELTVIQKRLKDALNATELVKQTIHVATNGEIEVK